MNSRVSFHRTWASSKVCRYITPYMNTIEMAIMAPKRRYDMPPPIVPPG